MHFPPLRYFTDICGLRDYSVQSLKFLPIHNTRRYLRSTSWGKSQRLPSKVQYESATTTSATPASYCPKFSDQRRTFPIHVQNLASSPYAHDPKAWIALIEPFLPIELRCDLNSFSRELAEREFIKPIREVLPILSEAQRTLNVELISYLGVTLKRWKALMWLVKRMSSSHLISSRASQHQRQACVSLWREATMSFDELTLNSIWADDLIKPSSYPDVNLESLTEISSSEASTAEYNADRESIGHVWRCVASLLLEATDRRGEASSQAILSHVCEILAHLHHINAFPNSIYSYKSSNDPFSIEKPPILSMMSSQIMTALSDAAWRAESSESISATIPDGPGKGLTTSDLTKAIMQPQVDHIGIEIWLDLILWSCIEGGWIAEAASIVNEIDKRNSSPDSQWSTISWDSIDKPATTETGWSVRFDYNIAKSYMNGISGGNGVTGYGRDAPFIRLPSRKISSEVIMSLIDSMIIHFLPNRNHDTIVSGFRQCFAACERLLINGGNSLETCISNKARLRIIELTTDDLMQNPLMLEQILHLTPILSKDVQAFFTINHSYDLSYKDVMANSTIVLSLFHQTLHCFAKQDDVRGALRTFNSLLKLIDENRIHLIDEFFKKVTCQPFVQRNQTRYPAAVDDIFSYYYGPPRIYATFLELITRTELWEIGNWLIYNDEPDGPVIPTSSYSERILQPSLLQYAAATADTPLLASITEKLEAPLPESILRALLNCQVAVAKWESVEDLLSFLRDERGMSWNASDVMTIAAAVIQLEKQCSVDRAQNSKSLSQAYTILQRLLYGEFNSARDPSKGSDLSQPRLLNQLLRILKEIPGKLSSLRQSYASDSSRIYANTPISVDAFNILMAAVVKYNGSNAGKQLWDLWSRDVGKRKSITFKEGLPWQDPYEELQRVVQPNLQTLRIILQPIFHSKFLAGKNAKSAIIERLALRASSVQNINTWGTKIKHGISVNLDPESSGPDKYSLLDEARILEGWGVKMKESDAEYSVWKWGIQKYKEFRMTREEIDEEVSYCILEAEASSLNKAVSQ